jgi:tyrosyl-tRNA synthetase
VETALVVGAFYYGAASSGASLHIKKAALPVLEIAHLQSLGLSE